MRGCSGRVAELADAKDLGSFGEILAGSTPVAPTPKHIDAAGRQGDADDVRGNQPHRINAHGLACWIASQRCATSGNGKNEGETHIGK